MKRLKEDGTYEEIPYVPTANKFKVLINGVDYTRYVPFPIKIGLHLDERLDEGRISMRHIPVEHFPMFADVQITMERYDGSSSYEKSFVLASDDSSQIISRGQLWNHEMTLIEKTKLLERIVVDSITFTNDLGRNYTKGAISVTPVIVRKTLPTGAEYVTPNNYKNPLENKEFTFVSSSNLFTTRQAIPFFSLKVSQNGVVIYNSGYVAENESQPYTSVLQEGWYEIEYGYEERSTGGTLGFFDIKYTFNVVQNQDPLPLWNITEVINRVLDVAETRILGVSPRYKLNAEQAEKFSTIEAPEFAFTRSTLKEVLDQIGGYIHGIPRLEGDTIYYDMLGGIEYADLSNLRYCANVTSQNIEDYATSLDSTMDNLVSIVNQGQGTVNEPYNNGYKTVRNEQIYARIEEGNMCIETQFPIQDIVSIECGLLPTAPTVKGGDITPYVFEEADYVRLSSYDENYPTSRAYAIYFTQGQKNIRGLGFKVKDATGGVFSRYAIANIIQATSGQDIGTAWSNDNYPRLAFRVSYIPIFSSRLQQHKSYIGDLTVPSARIFNQGANLIETKYFGENIKGAVARIGNKQKMITYSARNLNFIPKVGQLFDEDYYISSISIEYLQYYYYFTVELSKDFNRLSQYIGINSQRRYYEISEKQAYDRDIIYTDYCVVGDPVEADVTLVKDNAIEYIRRTFLQKPVGAEYKSISNVVAVGNNPSGDLTPVLLPATSTAFGNAMVFSFRYEDNYSAGNKASKSVNANVSGYFTQSVPYADYYGRFDNLKFDFANGGPTPSDIDSQTNVGLLLPQWVVFVEGRFLTTGANNPLVVRKDGRETLAMNYQLEFVTNRKNLVIGSGLCNDCPLVSGMQDNAVYASLYILPKRLSKFDEKVDLSGGIKVVDFTNDNYLKANGQSLVFERQTANANGSSWAIVNSITGALYLGENISVQNGQALNLPTMTFKHNIYK